MHSTIARPCPEGLGNFHRTHRDGDRLLQLLIFNEEFGGQPAFTPRIWNSWSWRPTEVFHAHSIRD